MSLVGLPFVTAVQYIADKKTSRGSTAPYSIDDIDHLLKVLKEIDSSKGTIVASIPDPITLLNATLKGTKKHSHNMW